MRFKKIIVVMTCTIFLLTNFLPSRNVSASQMTDLMRMAYQYLGTPYEWGGNGPLTFDCSGYTSYIYRNSLGIDIGRTTYDQVYAGSDVTHRELQPGDLILPNIDHVQLYIGNNMIIHAPQTGDVVNVDKLYNIYSARRIVGESKIEAALFDYIYYADEYPDLKAKYGYDYGKLYCHYITCGITEGRKPSVVFDPVYYLDNNLELKNAFGNDYQAAYDHFVSCGYKENRNTSSEFNIINYRNSHSEVSSMSNLELYIMIIESRSKIQRIMFDYKYYADTYPNLYLKYGYDYQKLYNDYINVGINEGRSPSLIFDPQYYLKENEDIQVNCSNNYKEAYNHFVNYGYKEKRNSSEECKIGDLRNNYSEYDSMSDLELYELIRDQNKIENVIFDYKYYADTYLDLKEKYGYDYKNLYSHYINVGINEGRSPSLIFDPKYYLQENEDVQAICSNNYKEAYNHFVNYGYKEKIKSSEKCNIAELRNNHHEYDSMSDLELYKLIRDQNKIENVIFDYKYYADTYSDLKEKYGYDYKNLYSHYVNEGINEGRSPSMIFNPKYYLQENEDVQANCSNNYKEAYNHFVKFGYKENRISSQQCDIAVYKLMHGNETKGLENTEIYKMYKENPEISRNYSIEFIDLLGNKIGDTQVVLSGNNAVEPSVPEIEGYKFVKWDKDFNNITDNLKVYAEYVKEEELTPNLPSEQDKPLIKFDSANAENIEQNNNQDNVPSNGDQNNNPNTFDNNAGLINIIVLTMISGLIIGVFKKKNNN